MRKFAALRIVMNGSNWLFALVVIGYPFFGLLATLFDVDSIIASRPFRIGITALALLLLLRPLLLNAGLGKNYLLLIFWIIYIVRLLWDFAIGDQPGVPEALAFFILTVLLPCIALFLNAQYFDHQRAAWVITLIGGTVCLMAVCMDALKLGQGRVIDIGIPNRLFFEALNPISLGNAAVTTLIAVLCIANQRPKIPVLIFIIAVAALAYKCLILSASRGPSLSLIVCALLFAVFTMRWGRLALMALISVLLVLSMHSEVGSRFSSISEDESAAQRLHLVGNAAQQFLASPFLGSAYVELELKQYPHNIFLETAMSLGLVGLIILFVILFFATRTSISQLRNARFLVPLLFAQYFVSFQFSGSLWGSSAFWACLVLLLAPQREKYTQHKQKQLSVNNAPGRSISALPSLSNLGHA